ncbi:uncharacterized protein BO87DRAFT_386792 [Aspergillus neoniger CBS 115656]|uniref:Uncharacterized protein n=1 Tax=Aspergillus neoniger (strain CBS 115656) TaxID=1448310 RepID=A0A318YJ38_ASPNB|nr:hypothetical protein BO87DRAFT_386792 [Aspergillus neoniger CBS 115656]PYH34309.1 hypothetical protein BO87DRAFT_386792 [Aspergillus neoniger CBS 115656]
MGTSTTSLSDDRLLSISRTEPSSTPISENEQQAIWKTCSVFQRKMFLGTIYFSEIDMTSKDLLVIVRAKLFLSPGKDAVTMEKVLGLPSGERTHLHPRRNYCRRRGERYPRHSDNGAYVDWHAALSEREISSIQNPAFSRFCHARGTPATWLTSWPRSEREEAATGFIDSDVEPNVLSLETSTDDVPVNTDSLSANPVTLVEAHDHFTEPRRSVSSHPFPRQAAHTAELAHKQAIIFTPAST